MKCLLSFRFWKKKHKVSFQIQFTKKTCNPILHPNHENKIKKCLFTSYWCKKKMWSIFSVCFTIWFMKSSHCIFRFKYCNEIREESFQIHFMKKKSFHIQIIEKKKPLHCDFSGYKVKPNLWKKWSLSDSNLWKICQVSFQVKIVEK